MIKMPMPKETYDISAEAQHALTTFSEELGIRKKRIVDAAVVLFTLVPPALREMALRGKWTDMQNWFAAQSPQQASQAGTAVSKKRVRKPR